MSTDVFSTVYRIYGSIPSLTLVSDDRFLFIASVDGRDYVHDHVDPVGHFVRSNGQVYRDYLVGYRREATLRGYVERNGDVYWCEKPTRDPVLVGRVEISGARGDIYSYRRAKHLVGYVEPADIYAGGAALLLVLHIPGG